MWYDFLNLQEVPAYIIGSDENGTGAFAGPIVVTAVVYPSFWAGFDGLQDSKKYSDSKKQLALRAEHAERIYQSCLTFSQVYISSEEIDRQGMRNALLQAHKKVIQDCAFHYPSALVLVDGNMIIPDIKHTSVIQGDSKVPAITAAGILGKEERDWWMSFAHKKFPQYDFLGNVGYNSPNHHTALMQYGPCPLHRKSFDPIRKLLEAPL